MILYYEFDEGEIEFEVTKEEWAEYALANELYETAKEAKEALEVDPDIIYEYEDGLWDFFWRDAMDRLHEYIADDIEYEKQVKADLRRARGKW